MLGLSESAPLCRDGLCSEVTDNTAVGPDLDHLPPTPSSTGTHTGQEDAIEPGLCEQMLGFFVKEPSKLHGVKDTLCALSVPPPKVTKPLRFLAATWEKRGQRQGQG